MFSFQFTNSFLLWTFIPEFLSLFIDIESKNNFTQGVCFCKLNSQRWIWLFVPSKWFLITFIYLFIGAACVPQCRGGGQRMPCLSQFAFMGVYHPFGIELISPCLAERAFTHWAVPPAQMPKLSEAGGSIRGGNFRVRFRAYDTLNFSLCKSRSNLQGEMQIMIIPLFIPSFKIDVTLEHVLSDSIFLNKVQSYACCLFYKHKNNFKTFYCSIIAQNDWHWTFIPMANANAPQFPLGMFVINSTLWMINFHVVSSWYFPLFNWGLFHPESVAKTLYLKIFREAISITTAMQAPSPPPTS